MDAGLELRQAVPRLVLVPSADPLAGGRRSDRQEVEPPHPAAELVELLLDAVADGVIDRDDAEVIARSRIADDPMQEIAAGAGIGVRTMWRRRQRAELALRTRHLDTAPAESSERPAPAGRGC
jgi:hypothetical protein